MGLIANTPFSIRHSTKLVHKWIEYIKIDCNNMARQARLALKSKEG
jgi:hypothetical protein